MSFRICTIGCGGMATAYHGPSYVKYRALHPDTELVACCARHEESAARYRTRFGFARSYTDVAKMLETEKPDAVCLMLPEPLTCEVSCQVLSMGLPLIMEKPPGRTTEEVDRMIAAAEASGAPTQVALNRRYMPMVRELRRWLTERLAPGEVQHIRYDFTRVGRTDADFSLTAIHGIDTVRYLAGADYQHIRFHYQEFPNLGPTTANIYMDCVMTSGVTAHLEFCPVAGVTVERATVHAHDHTFFLHTPMWTAFDAPGRLQHVHKGALLSSASGLAISDGGEGYDVGGFYAENAFFFDDVRHGRRPEGDLRAARQSVIVGEYLRERRAEYHRPV